MKAIDLSKDLPHDAKVTALLNHADVSASVKINEAYSVQDQLDALRRAALSGDTAILAAQEAFITAVQELATVTKEDIEAAKVEEFDTLEIDYSAIQKDGP